MSTESRQENLLGAVARAEADFSRLEELVQRREEFIAKGVKSQAWESRQDFLNVVHRLWASASGGDANRPQRSEAASGLLERHQELLFRAYGHAVCSRRRPLWTTADDVDGSEDEDDGDGGRGNDGAANAGSQTVVQEAAAAAAPASPVLRVEVRLLSGAVVFQGDFPETAAAADLRQALAAAGMWGAAAEDGARLIRTSAGGDAGAGGLLLAEADLLSGDAGAASDSGAVAGSPTTVNICLIQDPRRAGMPSLCRATCSLLAGSLQPLAAPRLKVLCYLMAGDVHRCAGDLQPLTGGGRSTDQNAAKEVYEKGRRIAQFECQGYDPLWLGLMLQLSVLYREGLRDPWPAIDVARRAYQDARGAGGGSVPEEWFQEANWFMRRLRENLLEWQAAASAPPPLPPAPPRRRVGGAWEAALRPRPLSGRS